MNATLDRVGEIFLHVVPDLEISEGIDPAARFGRELDIDSLSLVEILIQVEKRFSIEMDDDEIAKVTSVQDILDIIQRRN